MAFLFEEYLLRKKDPENVPELFCGACAASFPVYLGFSESAEDTVRFACQRCPDLAVMDRDGFYPYCEPSSEGFDGRKALIQKNLKPCPKDGGAFLPTDDIFCPFCHARLEDWVWGYFAVSHAGDLAFADPSAKREYLAYWKSVSGDPCSLKKMTAKAWAFAREGRIRAGARILEEVKARYYFVSRGCYHNEEILREKPDRGLLELLGKGLERAADPADEDALIFQYQQAYFLARLSGRIFERIPDLPRVFSPAPAKKTRLTGEELTRETLQKLVRSFTTDKHRAVSLPESQRILRITEMQSKITAGRQWWLQNRDSWPAF